jgi:hypothetical protein
LKIRLDENVSWRVAGALKASLSSEKKGLQVDWVRDHDPPKTSDPSWIRRFADEGGHAIISGDYNILQHWPNLIAYTESGLTSFFPPPAYQHLGGYGRAALIIRWFPAIVESIKSQERGSRWRLPMEWNADVTRLQPLKDPRIDTRQKQEERGINPAPRLYQLRAGDGSEHS